MTTGDLNTRVSEAIKGKVMERFATDDKGALTLTFSDGSRLDVAPNGAATMTQAPVTLSPPCRTFAMVPCKVETVETPESLAGEKPPATKLTIQGGIDMTMFGMGSVPANKYAWDRIVSQPPFQEYVKGRHPSFDDADPLGSCIEFLKAQAGSGAPETAVFDVYANWFEAAGRWPEENPDGSIRVRT